MSKSVRNKIAAIYPNPYVFNRGVWNRMHEAHIQVVAPNIDNGRGDFTVQPQGILGSYQVPHICSVNIITFSHEAHMKFYQDHINLSVWYMMLGCVVSWRDQLDHFPSYRLPGHRMRHGWHSRTPMIGKHVSAFSVNSRWTHALLAPKELWEQWSWDSLPVPW